MARNSERKTGGNGVLDKKGREFQGKCGQC